MATVAIFLLRLSATGFAGPLCDQPHEAENEANTFNIHVDTSPWELKLTPLSGTLMRKVGGVHYIGLHIALTCRPDKLAPSGNRTGYDDF